MAKEGGAARSHPVETCTGKGPSSAGVRHSGRDPNRAGGKNPSSSPSRLSDEPSRSTFSLHSAFQTFNFCKACHQKSPAESE